MEMNILIVEDDPTSAKLLNIGLRRLGYNIAGVAQSGPEAIDMTKKTQPDVVIMDINLPGEFDGIRAAEIIKQEFDIPVLFLSANTEESIIKRAVGSDPIGYISKPYTWESLRVIIETGVYRYKTEARIKEKEEFLSVLLSSIDDGVIVIDSQSHIKFINSSAHQILGIENNINVMDTPIEEFLKLYDEISGVPIQWMGWESAETIYMHDAILKNKREETIYVEYRLSRLASGKKINNQYLISNFA